MNKGRTFLTMLGIIIGISSVIAILSVGNGLKGDLTSTLDSLDTRSASITIDPKKTVKYLTNNDLQVISDAIPVVKGATPVINSWGNILLRKTVEVNVIGANESYINEFDKGMYAGRFYTASDVENGADVCVVSQVAALLIFNSYDVNGMEISLEINGKTREVTIMGVLRNSDEEIAQARTLIEKHQTEYAFPSIYVPFSLMTSKYGLPGENITSFSIYPVSGKLDEAVSKTISVTENLLDIRGEKAVSTRSLTSFFGTFANILDSVTLVIALIAAISLLVGGIGVMNIMTVTVTERTREIGIRKSLGARTSQILIQFLIESSMITLFAGLIGMILGFLLSRIIGSLAGIAVSIRPVDVTLVVIVSTGIGIFFGIYPARKAALLNPVDALRME